MFSLMFFWWRFCHIHYMWWHFKETYNTVIYRLFPRCLYESYEIIHQKKPPEKKTHTKWGHDIRHFVLHGSWEEDWWSSWRTSHYGLDGTGAGTRYHHHQCSGGAQCLDKVLKLPPNEGWRICFRFFCWRCCVVSICFHIVFFNLSKF